MASRASQTPSDQLSRGPVPPDFSTLTRGEQPETDLEIKRSHFLARAAVPTPLDEAP